MRSSFWRGIDQFALDQPIFFSIAITVLLLLLLLAAIFLGIAVSKDVSRRQIGESLGRILGATVLAFFVQRLGWFESVGFGFAGTLESWAIMTVALIYVILVFPYALTRSLNFNPQNPALARALALNAASAALVEEITFRGIILFALVRVWEGGRAGVLGAVFISSLLFSLIHVLNLLAGESITRVAPQAVWSFLGGFFFASLVIRGMSIWPAIFLHASANVSVRLNLQSKPDYHPSNRAFICLAGLAVPLAILGIALL